MSEKAKNKKSILDEFGTNITEKARNGELDPVIGRKKELDRATQILSRRKKNNLIFIGNPGVGKTEMANLIAQQIVDKKVSYILQDKEIYSLDMASMVAGTKYRGQFEERMVGVINHIKEKGNIILFLDEIHTVLGAGSASGSLDAANILKPALSRGEIQCIGATTIDEYREHIEKDGALVRRFQKIDLEDPSIDETIEILKQLKNPYENYHNVTYSDSILEKIPTMAVKYISDRHLPDSAIDVVDETGAKAQTESIRVSEKIVSLEKKMSDLNDEKNILVSEHRWEEIREFKKRYDKVEEKLLEESIRFETELKNREKINITEDDILKVISSMSNIPLDKLKSEGQDIIKVLQETFKNRLIGQPEAAEKIVKALKRSIVGISNPNRPIASFLLLGKSGQGKCIVKDSKITVRNKKTGEVERLTIEDFNILTE